jgi:hypothetical protein
METADINQALRIYLGAAPNGGVRPYGMDERLGAAYGSGSDDILEQVKQVIDNLWDHDADMMLPSLQAIGHAAAQRARVRYPDLDDDVCRAIGNYISYSYR